MNGQYCQSKYAQMFDMLRRDFKKTEADNRVVAGGEDGYINGTRGLPVGIHLLTGSLPAREALPSGRTPDHFLSGSFTIRFHFYGRAFLLQVIQHQTRAQVLCIYPSRITRTAPSGGKTGPMYGLKTL